MTKPLVDVVIPVYGQPHLVIRAVDSIRTQPRLGHIFIQDDKSPQEVSDVLKNLAGDQVSVNTNIENMGFVRTVNRAIKKFSQAKYVLILNSDTQAVTPKAIEAMANNLDDGAAVCGALLVYPNGSRMPGAVQHAGVTFDFNGYPTHIFAGLHPQNPAVQTWRSINSVTGACMMVKREVWDRLEGFDSKFTPGVFEDIDLCLRVRRLNKEVIYEPGATFFHWEHASQNGAGWFSQENLNRNFALLVTKHGQPKCDIELFAKIYRR